MSKVELANVEVHNERLDEMAAEFRRVMKQKADPAAAYGRVVEEADEVLKSISILVDNPTVENMGEFIKESADLLYVMAGLKEQAEAVGEEKAQEMLAEKYNAFETFASQMLVGQAVDNIAFATQAGFFNDKIAMEAVERVHKSNLSKLDDEGNAIFNEEGKVMKGPNYKPPVLTDLAEGCLAKYNEYMEQIREQGEAA